MSSPRGLPRWFEVAAAGGLLLVLSPLLGLLAVLIRLGSPGPALFRQTRVGRVGRPFELLKLRSMKVGDAGPAVTASGDPRITMVGRFLRRAKLDELPQLWNVVRGDMALVGPRPEVPSFVDPADPLWQRVLAVRPGLTDPLSLSSADEAARIASFGGDAETAYREHLLPGKLAAQVAYLERRSWRSDLAVIGATMVAVVRGVGKGRSSE